MNVTRDVITDLLPLVLAGEASEDSRKLVESYLERDPELARLAQARPPRLSSDAVPAPLEKEVEMKTLERTRKLLSWRSAALGCGVFFAVFPVVYSANSHRWYWLPIESPVGAAISALLGLACWATFFWIRRSLRTRGL